MSFLEQIALKNYRQLEGIKSPKPKPIKGSPLEDKGRQKKKKREREGTKTKEGNGVKKKSGDET